MGRSRIGIGLVGSGFMGRCHANAFRSVGGLFDLPVSPVPEMLADATHDLAAAAAARLGFSRHTGDWRELTRDPKVELVAVTAPNALHEAIVLSAITEGKSVYCEKPLSTTTSSARRMAEAAAAAGTATLVGFNFLRNPMVRLAQEIIAAGEIGEVTSFRGRHAESYMASPDVPHSFRTDPEGGGALADIGSHIISMARYLLGAIVEVNATCRTLHPTRPVRSDAHERTPVKVDDATHALLRFGSGAEGSLEANWAATGRTMDLSFEVTGTRGAIVFSQERMNELWICDSSAPAERSGFRRIESGPAHPPYAAFCPAPGHHLGFNDLKVIEVAELLTGLHRGTGLFPDFAEALAVQETVEAMQISAREATWRSVPLN